VPVAAAGLADVGAADPDPPVVLRAGEHFLEKLAVGLLDEGALGEDAVGFGESRRERVANLLQLTEVEHPGRPGGLDPMGDAHPAHPLGDQSRQLPLEPADLPPQLLPRPRLVDVRRPSFRHPPGYERKRADLSPVEQVGHKQILSRLEGRGGNP